MLLTPIMLQLKLGLWQDNNAGFRGSRYRIFYTLSLHSVCLKRPLRIREIIFTPRKGPITVNSELRALFFMHFGTKAINAKHQAYYISVQNKANNKAYRLW